LQNFCFKNKYFLIMHSSTYVLARQ
jgi:hypothetical protein